MKIEKNYAIDTTGNYPIALIRYQGWSPSWRQYQNNKDIQDYLKNHNSYEINTNKSATEYF